MPRTASIIRRRYRDLLRRSMVPHSASTVRAAQRLAGQATAAGMSTLDIAIMHEQLLEHEMPLNATSRQRRSLTTEAGALFTSVLEAPVAVPVGITQQLHALLSDLSRRTIDLSAANLSLTKRIKVLKRTSIVPLFERPWAVISGRLRAVGSVQGRTP